MPKAVILDVDGTLVDSVYQHAICWHRAFERCGVPVPVWRCHRHIGMGGDQIVPTLAGDAVESEHGERLRELEGDLFAELIGEVKPLDGAIELIAALSERGQAVVLSSSAKERDIEHYVGLLEAGGRIAGYTTSGDVDSTKPDPEVIDAALGIAGTRDAIMVGDSVWDIRAAERAGIGCLGLLSGGFSEGELLDSGARAVYSGPGELVGRLSETDLTG
jgi:HAD superfamily hydrolase (TIGR01509 family)